MKVRVTITSSFVWDCPDETDDDFEGVSRAAEIYVGSGELDGSGDDCSDFDYRVDVERCTDAKGDK